MRLSDLFQQRVQDVSDALQIPLPVTWDVGDYAHFKTPRGFGVTFRDFPGAVCHIRLSKKLLRSPQHRQDGIIRHELGHVIDLTFPAREVTSWAASRGVRLAPQKHGELRADDIAHAVWLEPLRYEKPLFVQSTKKGVCPRPAHLGK